MFANLLLSVLFISSWQSRHRHFFCFEKISLAYWSLIISCLFKLAIMCIDYRLMGDYHYITLIVTLCYLFVPGKWNLARVLIVGFYFSAGTLKFNNEWLSGSALIDDPKIYGIALEWLCLYVIVLETCMAPLLLFTKSRVVAALVLAQLFLFHVYSYLIVGFFFPTIYFLLLAVFPLSWKSKATLRLASLTKVDWIAITLFVLAQMIPTLQSGDPALVGRGRHFAVHIMDATSECFPRFYVRMEKETIEVQGNNQMLSFRIRCDPLVYWNQGHNLCRMYQGRPGFKSIEFLMSSRRLTDSAFTSIASVENFCNEARDYNTLRSNDWMAK